jgi:hypothetical protein
MRQSFTLSVGLLALRVLSVSAHAQSSPPNQAPVLNVGDQSSDSGDSASATAALHPKCPSGKIASHLNRLPAGRGMPLIPLSQL